MWAFIQAIGIAHFAAERYEEAVNWGQQLLERRQSEFAYRMLAASYAHLGRLDEAEEALQEALQLEPDLTLAKVRLQAQSWDPSVTERAIDGYRKAGLPE
jgi:adenylate cyclase